MDETWLGSSTCGKDLGIFVDYNINMSHQCGTAGDKVKGILVCINRGVVSRSKKK